MLTLIQSLWAVLLALWAGVLIWNGHPSGGAFVALALAHAFVTFKLHGGARWAWWASWPLPVAALCLAAPMVVYNFYLYFTDASIYRDSPGTILTVIVSTLVFVVPAIAIALLLMSNRRAIARDRSLEQARG